MKLPAPSRYQSENVDLKRRVFFYSDKTNRKRSDRYFKLIKGNRAIHCITSRDNGGTLETRDLSCYCGECLVGNYNSCENSSYVNMWETRDLERERGRHRRNITRSDTAEKQASLSDLIVSGSVVAIASGDDGHDYYLLQV